MSNESAFLAVSPPHDGLGAIDLAVVAVYLAGTFGIALYFSRQHGSTEEFFLGGRRMPWFAVGLSIMASLLSTISYLSPPGETIKFGVASFTAIISLPFSIVLIFWFGVPFFMRLNLTSAYEYLEYRFNYTARVMAAVLFIFLRLGWMGVVVYTSSLALSEMSGYEIDSVILVVGVFATVYTAVGGIRAVIWTDVVQALTLVLGVIVTIGYIAYVTDSGIGDWWEAAGTVRQEHTSPIIFSWDITIQRTVVTFAISGFFWIICTHFSDQVVLQRYFATTSLKAARRSYLVNVVFDTTMMVLLAVCGLALLHFYTQHPSYLHGGEVSPTEGADKVFPYFISHQLPAGIGGLILAALVAAAMSSIDSGVNSVTAVVTTDLVARSNRGSGSAASVRTARILTLVIGAVATGMALWVTRIAKNTNIVELMPKGFNMFLGPLSSFFFIGMFLPRVRAWSAIGGVSCGTACAVIWSYWTELFGPSAEEYRPTFLLAVCAPVVVSMSAAWLLSFTHGGGRHSGSDYNWWAVVRERSPQ